MRHSQAVTVGIESLLCNEGAFYLERYRNGTAGDDMNVITGTCGLGGPDCRFVMTRQ